MVQRLGSLPKSDDEYWDRADTHLTEMRDEPKCKHYIVRLSGKEVECKKCHMGFFVGPRDRVRSGHLYRGKLRVI